MIILFHTYEIRKPYICVFSIYFMEVKFMERHLRFIEKIVTTLNLSKMGVEILTTLHEKRKFLVPEISEHLQRSEKHACQQLHVLHEKGFLKKEIEVLKNKRLTYHYSLNIVNEAKIRLQKRIDELYKLIVE